MSLGLKREDDRFTQGKWTNRPTRGYRTLRKNSLPLTVPSVTDVRDGTGLCDVCSFGGMGGKGVHERCRNSVS